MALSLDGHGSTNTGSGTSVAVSLTTTTNSGVIVVLYVANLAPAASNPVTATGLTFTNRLSTNSGGNFIAEYTAPYSANFSGNITVSASGTTFITGLAFGIGGAATSSFFDSNASLPGISSSGSVTVSTSNANDFIFGFGVNGNGTPGGWTTIDSAANSNFCANGYQIVSTTQTNLVFTSTGISAVDAIIQASAATKSLFRPANLDGLSTGGQFFANPLARSMIGWRKRKSLSEGAYA